MNYKDSKYIGQRVQLLPEYNSSEPKGIIIEDHNSYFIVALDSGGKAAPYAPYIGAAQCKFIYEQQTINMQTSIKIPEKWSILITEENRDVFLEWARSKSAEFRNYKDSWHLIPGYYFYYPQTDMNGWMEKTNQPKDSHTLINFDEFKAFYLEQPFVLPQFWFVKATRENEGVLTTWRGGHYVEWRDTLIMVSTKIWSDIRNIDTRSFKEITFEQFEQYVLKKPSFVLPKKWCINRTGKKDVIEWFEKNSDNRAINFHQDCLGPFTHYPKADNYTSQKVFYGYTEITHAQFKKYVLKQDTSTPKKSTNVEIVLKRCKIKVSIKADEANIDGFELSRGELEQILQEMNSLKQNS